MQKPLLYLKVIKVKDTIDIVKEIINSKRGITLAILYGSFATGRITPGSDIDIAVAAKNPMSPEELAEINLEISEKTGRNTDVVDLNRAEGILLKEILTKGKLLKKEDSNQYAKFIIKMLDYQEDMAPNVRHILNTKVKRFLKNG